MGKSVLIFVLGSMILFDIVNINMNDSVGMAAVNSTDVYKETCARNIANSVSFMLISRVADSTNYRAYYLRHINSIFGGSARYRVYDTLISGQSYIKISVQGIYLDKIKTANVLTQIPSGGFIPPTVKAAISTNNDVNTLGTLNVDGRDHDLFGNVIPGQGTLGIWSTQEIEQSGSSKIGGGATGTDYSPSKPANSDVVQENASYDGGYPNTPDSTMGGTAKGFPPGKLKSLAQSGVNGSQYVTNPSYLTFPLRGVTYVELPPGAIWNSSNIDGSGILVVHNNSLNAVIKNENLGTFRGLIIADDIIHIHTNIIGAVIALTPNPSDGNCIGNGSGNVLFSRKALLNGIGEIVKVSNFGFAKTRIVVSNWYE